MIVKSGLEKIFLKFLHAGDYFPLLYKSAQNYKLSNKNNYLSSRMEGFQKKKNLDHFSPSFLGEMLKFHPFSILTGDTMVGFVIFCVLNG